MSSSVDHARIFLLLNGRLLERQLFAHLFDGADAQLTLRSLRAYQNADGGFGNGLEPDKRSPESQPIDVEFALRILDMIELSPDDIVLPACDFLTQITTAEGGIPFALPSVKRYPRAPWWDVDDEPSASLNPTASVAALLMQARVSHHWIGRVSPFCWRAIEAYTGSAFHEVMPSVMFLEQASDVERRDLELDRIRERVAVAGVIAKRGTAGYAKYPLDWAPRPTSPLRSLFDDATIEQDLDALEADQQEDGGWPINWPAISPVVEYEWRGWKTVDARYVRCGRTAASADKPVPHATQVSPESPRRGRGEVYSVHLEQLRSG